MQPHRTPTLLTDSNGSVVWSAQYAPFGDAIIDEDPDGDGRGVTFNLRFPGQYYDAESGLHYNWHRFYDPETGRYVTADPIGLAGGINQYAYVGGNPINWIDPRGLYPAPWCSKLDILLGKCPDIGKDIKPKDIPEEWFNYWLEDICSKPCSKIATSYRKALAPGCYSTGTPCLIPCEILKKKCEEKRKKICNPRPCEKGM